MEIKAQFKAKEAIFKEGDSADKLFIIESGEVICLKASKDRLIPIFVAKKGDIIGENAMAGDGFYGHSAIAVQDVSVIHIPALNLKEALEKGPVWLSELSRVMISRFQSTASLVAENRVIHNTVIAEENFPSDLEVEYKKILNLN